MPMFVNNSSKAHPIAVTFMHCKYTRGWYWRLIHWRWMLNHVAVHCSVAWVLNVIFLHTDPGFMGSDVLKMHVSRQTQWFHVTTNMISRGRSGKIARLLRSRIAYYYNTRSSVPLDLSCVTIVRRDFIWIDRLVIFLVLTIHTFDGLKFEIKTFIQPFANYIKGAHS